MSTTDELKWTCTCCNTRFSCAMKPPGRRPDCPACKSFDQYVYADDSSPLGLVDHLERRYAFECEGGALANCVEWRQLRAVLSQPQQPAPAEPVAVVIAEDEPETRDVGFVDWIGGVSLKYGTKLYTHPAAAAVQPPVLPLTEELPPLPEPYKAPPSMFCVACGRPYEVSRAIAPMASGMFGSPLMTGSGCECGSNSFKGTIGDDQPVAAYTAEQMRDYAVTCVAAFDASTGGQRPSASDFTWARACFAPLTDDEILQLASQHWAHETDYGHFAEIAFARAIEAKVRGTGSVPPSANLDVHPAQRSTQGARTEPGDAS